MLACVIFLVALFFVPAEISPTVTKEIKASPFVVQQALSDINKFREWDPKASEDTTVTYQFSMKNDKPSLVMVDSLKRVLADYSVESSSPNEVTISVNIKNTPQMLYQFELEQIASGTRLTWKMDLEVKLMIVLFDGEEKLEERFKKGLESFSKLVSQ